MKIYQYNHNKTYSHKRLNMLIFSFIIILACVSFTGITKDAGSILRSSESAIVTLSSDLTSSTGSGFLISKDGYLLTNNHVVGILDNMIVTFSNGHQYKAKVIERHLIADVALLKIHSNNKAFPFLKLGNSDIVKKGDQIISIGTAFGDYNGTSSFGFINSLNRNLANHEFYPIFFQSDNHINPGMSGGPTLNMKGEVIGLNARMISPIRDIKINVSISLITPINYAKDIIRR